MRGLLSQPFIHIATPFWMSGPESGDGVKLFLSQEDLQRTAAEVEMLPQSVLKIPLVRIPYILRQVAEECK